MARIVIKNHFQDNLGNQYHFNMTNHTNWKEEKEYKIEVCDKLCRFIFDTAINQDDITFTGWFEAKLGNQMNMMYWINSSCCLFRLLDVESRAQYGLNFLAFAPKDKSGCKQITINHFGPFGHKKTKELEKILKAKEEAEEKRKRAVKERRLLQQQKKNLEEKGPALDRDFKRILEEFNRRHTIWMLNENFEAFLEMNDKMIIKVAELVARWSEIEIAVKALEEITEIIAKATEKAGVKAGVKQIPAVGFVVGLVFGTWRLAHGDFKGACWELVSGTASLVPGVGTAVSLGIDAALLGRDIFETQENVKEKEEMQRKLYDEEFKEFKAQNNAMIKFLGDKIKEYKDIEEVCNHRIQGCDRLIELGVKS